MGRESIECRGNNQTGYAKHGNEQCSSMLFMCGCCQSSPDVVHALGALPCTI